MRNAMLLPPRWAAILVAALMVFGMVGTAMAQTDVTKARISGTIKDADGGALPGATLEVKSLDTGRVNQTVSDGKGFFRFIDLPTGNYELTCGLAGFATAKTNLRLSLGSAPTVDFTMQLAKAAEQITVTADVPIVEVTNTSASTTLQTEQVRQLPTVGRNFSNLVLATPETTTKNERNYLAISGQRGINTSVVVDGVDDNNPFFGGTIGGAEGRAPLAISQETVKEVSVITNGASVELGRSGGGFVNVITKSGTNDFHGSAWYFDAPQGLISDRADGTKPADQNKQQYGATFGGPFVKDKFFFFASYDQQKQNVTVPVNAAVLKPAISAKYPSFASDPQYVQTSDGYVLFGRLDYQFREGSQRVTGRVNYAEYNGENGTSSSQYWQTGHNGLENMFSRSYVGAWSGTFGNDWLNDLNLQWVIEDTPRQNMPGGAAYPEVQVGSGGGTYGGVSYLPINPTTVQRKSVLDAVTYLYGNQVFKGGFEYNDTSVGQIFKGNWRGVYIFNSEADMLAGKWSQYRQFAPLGGLTVNQAGTAAFGQKELAFFVQDQWYISPGLTASLGLRWEKLDNPNDPILNPNSKNADGSMNLNGQIPDVSNQWSPRFGISWSPGNNGKTVLRLSAGRFWSRTPAILFAQLYTSNGLRATQYIISWNSGQAPTNPLSPGWAAAFNPTLLAPISFANLPTPKGLGVFTIAPNFTNPHTDRVSVGWDQEIFKDTGLYMDATYAKAANLERVIDMNLQYDIDPATGQPKLSTINGQPMFSKTRPNTYYARITEYISDASSEYWGASLTLRQRFSTQLLGFLAVTYSKDKDNDSNERNYSGIQGENVQNLDAEWGYAIRDQRWKVALNGVWNTPWWGLSFSGVFRYLTGSPFTPATSSDANADSNFTDRPTIDGNHFARNSYRYPNFAALDLRLQKQFALGPGDVAVIVQCFNCTNNSNRGIGNTTWGNLQTPAATFNKNNLVTIYPRTIELAVRYDF